MEDTAKSGGFLEWVVPLLFIIATGWAIWHLPAYMIDFIGYEGSKLDQIVALHYSNDVTPDEPGVFGGTIDKFDLSALIAMPLLLFLGVKTVCRAPMEFEDWTSIDRLSVFIGRITMMLIALMTGVMLYEVLLRYVFERPTLWANELTLWIAGFVFLCSGIYAMQQRCHIRIFLLYDIMPRGIQRLFDCIWTFLLALFAFFLVYGSYKQVFVNKLYKWETFGTAFDPPLPATIQPMILIAVTLVAIQSIINLISDWNAVPKIHTAADDIDEDELRRIRAAVGADGVGDFDVTRGAHQSANSGKN